MLLTALGLEKGQWKKLLDVPAAKLVELQSKLGPRMGGGSPLTRAARGGLTGRAGGFGPIVDGKILPQHPFDPAAPAISKNKPLLIGTNLDETTFMFMGDPSKSVFQLNEETLKQRLERELGTDAAEVLKTYKESRPGASPTDLYIAITTATMFWNSSITAAERKAAQGGAPVYMYLLTHRSDWKIPGTGYKLGSAHATDLLYTFDNVYPDGQWPPQGKATMYEMVGGGEKQRQVARNMSGLFSSFAKSSKPEAQGVPAWPAYTTKDRATMQIDAPCQVAQDPFGAERRMWQKLGY